MMNKNNFGLDFLFGTPGQNVSNWYEIIDMKGFY